MKISIHSLHWDNVDQKMVRAQEKVLDHLGLPVVYTRMNIPHGMWADSVCRNSDSDVIVLIDVDCVPLDRAIVDESVTYAFENNTFVGPAQTSNHIPPATHIYAGPGFFAINQSCYRQLGMPSFSETGRADCGEEVSYVAEENGKRYRLLYPTRFDAVPHGGTWRLGDYGFFGIGTLYEDRIYHLYQSRFNNNVDLFCRRCDQIVAGEFDMSGMHDSRKGSVGI